MHRSKLKLKNKEGEKKNQSEGNRTMASSSSTTVTPSSHLHLDLPPWKIELIQRKKKFNTSSAAISPNGSIQRTVMQFDNSNDGNFGKCLIIKIIRSKQITNK